MFSEPDRFASAGCLSFQPIHSCKNGETTLTGPPSSSQASILWSGNHTSTPSATSLVVQKTSELDLTPMGRCCLMFTWRKEGSVLEEERETFC